MISVENNNRSVMDDINLAQIIAPFDFTKKKKKKKVAFGNPLKNLDNMSVNDNADKDEDYEEEAGNDQLLQQSLCPWERTDRGYLYAELLDRVFSGLGDRHKTRMKLPVPEVLRQGSKKTVHVNFMDFCKAMHRQPDHLSSFVEMELATNLSLDERKQLVVNGRFAPKHFEAVLRKYANEYVICSGCKSSDTNLCKENRLMFLRCEQCGSGRSVPSITPGFRALTVRRRAGA